MGSRKGLKFQLAISIMVVFCIIFSVLVNWYTATNAMRSSLQNEYLDNNYNYAKKLSQNTADLLSILQDNLTAAAEVAGRIKLTQGNLDIWKSANGMDFNSVFITDSEGVIQVISPSVIQYKSGVKVQAGMKLKSDGMKAALSMREPFISKPYRATSGQLVLLLSAPIFDDSGEYQGLVAGTIYLETESALKRVLENHEFENGSYVYVVDQTGHIIYHPDKSRINELVDNNAVVKKIKQGKSGTAIAENSQGKEFFMGYAYEETSGWGIVSQTPATVLDEPLSTLFKEMVLQSLPYLAIVLIIAWVLAYTFSKPLTLLTKFSRDAITHKKIVPVEELNIRSNIYEVKELFHHIKKHINLLNTQIQIDGLTGVANRRTFDTAIMEYVETKTPFSLIMLDIDRFKLVNDTYGHLIGDDVLKFLCRTMEGFCGEDEFCFRYGGEEFVILIKDKRDSEAYVFAEKLRNALADMVSPTGKPITISLGITSMQPYDRHPKTIVERADAALYQSKSEGRNRTTIYKQENHIKPA